MTYEEATISNAFQSQTQSGTASNRDTENARPPWQTSERQRLVLHGQPVQPRGAPGRARGVLLVGVGAEGGGGGHHVELLLRTA